MFKYLSLLTLLCASAIGTAQLHLAKNFKNDPNLPQWAKIMYEDGANPIEVKRVYDEYFDSHPFEKTVHTQYYKRWVNAMKGIVDLEGKEVDLNRANNTKKGGGEIWTYCGPQVHYTSDGNVTPISEHSNVYCHDRSPVNHDVLYCGTESGGLYKSIDAGNSWSFVTKDIILGGVSAVACHPTDVNIVLFSGANDIYKSTDGGITWNLVGDFSFVSQNISVWEFAFHPTQPNVLFAATNQGLFRSEDTGETWLEVLPNECMTVRYKPNDYSVVYTVQYEPSLGISKFYKSIDGGITFTMFDTGWFSEQPGFTNVELLGGHLALTEADPDRIYVALAGYGTYSSGVELNGWIGLYVSYDAGETWSHPHGVIGTPYNAQNHANLMNFSGDDGTYTQIHYNTTLIASQLNPDHVLIGGLNVWKSTDAGATFQGVAGYIGGLPNYHVDQQEFKIYKDAENTETIWCSNDGGINLSVDFMETFTAKNNGIMAVNLWGYDQGWSEDIMVGGRYHNGNMGYHENYGQGNFLALGGGEAATGYVNYSDENKTYFSDLGGRYLPESVNALANGFSVSMFPNESYWFNESSRILFDSHHFNVAWLGRENKIYKSINGGQSWNEHFAFGTNTNSKVIWIEQSYADANVLFAQQRVGNTMKLWRSIDGGDTWNQVNIPLNQNNMVFSLGNSANEFFIGYTNAGSNQKVYYTTDGGATYANWSANIGNAAIWSIAAQLGTNAGVYVALLHGRVLYRNASMSSWVEYSSGLPAGTEPLRLVPFYRDNKLRLACWNLGVWEAPLYEASELMVDFSSAYGSFVCPGEDMHFVDHSVASADATYLWSFPGATPSTSTEKYPTVSYATSGIFDVTLTVTDNGVSESLTKQAYIQSTIPSITCQTTDFESGSIPLTWRDGHSTGGSSTFSLSNTCSAFGTGSYSMAFENYWIDVQGERDEIILEKQILDPLNNWSLHFDVAYAEYGGQYSDTLAVLISTDCGDTWEELWVKGGGTLATAPATTDLFTPTSTQWRSESIDLPESSDEVLIAFQNRGRWGNNFYVDNINVCFSASIENNHLVNANLYPNPTNGMVIIELQGGSRMQSLKIHNMKGQLVKENVFSNTMISNIDVSDLAKGIYTMTIQTDLGVVVKRLEKN
jgi:PKD repeat protein